MKTMNDVTIKFVRILNGFYGEMRTIKDPRCDHDHAGSRIARCSGMQCPLCAEHESECFCHCPICETSREDCTCAGGLAPLRKCDHNCARPDHDITRLSDLARELTTVVRSAPDIAKKEIYALQEGKCNGCLYPNPIQYMQIDHIVARAKGGRDAFSNMQLLCGDCNRKKGDKTMDYLRRRLIKEGIVEGWHKYGTHQQELWEI